MPLHIHDKILDNGEIGIWKIDETEAFFKSLLGLSHSEKEYINLIKGRKKLEWLASRYLLHYLSGRKERGMCLKDEYGKPYLQDSNFKISISHSWNYAAVIAGPKNVGIDIQRRVEKIERIKHKFLSSAELNNINEDHYIDHLHIYWGAKEAIFKAYGKKELEFKKHLLIEDFNLDFEKGRFNASLQKDSVTINYSGFYKIIDSYFLVYVIEI